jgi:DNA-binding NarL/FixJ family response regulator
LILEATGSHESRCRSQLVEACDWYGLTRRQRDIVWAMWDGLTESPQIAQRLGIADSTVKIHLAILYENLGVSNRLGVMLRLLGKPVKEDYRANA